jgi:predicted GIY-YIG superfamily endonuclease
LFQKRLGSRSLALKVESRVKRLSREKKEQMIRVPECIDEIVRQACE